MRQKIFLSALFVLFGFMQLIAQQRTITGHVTNSKDDSPISNASVLVGGEKKGVRTDADGNFSINVSPDAKKLTVSYVGMLAQTVDISTQNNVTVSLATATEALSDVVIVGYGSVRKKDLTGAVSNIQAKDFNKGQINSPEQLLQGKVPGLQITNSSGQPGGITIVKIRGNNSIRTGNTPLYVVDGIPLDGRSPRPNFAPAGVGNTPGGDALTFINPNEIANIEVLKDASASAIYGSRGANGVIMITTKKGPSGPASVHVGASFGFSDIMRDIDVLDAAGYRAAIKSLKVPNNTDSGANINPFKEIIRKSYTQNYSLALGGGGENGKYRASFFVSDQDGIILKTNLKKYVGNFNGQYKFLDNKLSIDFMTTVANVAEQIAPISQDAGSTGNLISLALIWNPTLSLFNKNGTFNQTNASGQVNPLALSKAYNDNTSITTLLASGAAGYKITPWLEYKFLYGLNYGTGERKGELQGWIKGTGGVADDQGIAAVQHSVLSSQIMTHTLSFTRDVIHNLSINGLLGYEYWSTNLKGNGSNVYKFDYNLDQTKLNNLHYYDNMEDGLQANLRTYSFKEPKVEIQSYFARAIFNYLDKYLLTGTIRADGSNKFGKNNKYAYFPSVAAAWSITKEPFMEGMTFFNQLKLRVGYGETGNQEFPADAASQVIHYGSNQSQNTNHFANADLKWETVKSIDIGLDYAFLSGKVYGAIDYFDKKTDDPIFLTVISQPSPGGTIYQNLLGSNVTNKGVEISVGADIVKTRDIAWSINANYTTVKNKFNYPKSGNGPLAFTGALHGQGSSGAYSEAIANGQPVDVFYVPTFKGFDKDGIGSYSPTSEYVGDPNPTSFMGFSTDISYKKWSLNLGAHGAFGNKIFNNTAMSVLNISNIVGGRNIASGLVTAGENVANAITPSTRYMEKGDYVKLHNATIKYTAGNIGKIVKNLSVYVSGNNLFVISKYKGFDPEVNVDKALNGIPSIGVDYIGYPTQRTFLIGFNFSL